MKNKVQYIDPTKSSPDNSRSILDYHRRYTSLVEQHQQPSLPALALFEADAALGCTEPAPGSSP